MQEPRRLTRDTDNKVIAGVCSGVANYFAVDPVLIRVGTVVLACVAGGGILAYLLAWIIMPAKTTQS